MFQLRAVKVADVIVGDVIDIADEPHRGSRWETVDAAIAPQQGYRHLFLKGIGYPIALIADDDRTVTVLRGD